MACSISCWVASGLAVVTEFRVIYTSVLVVGRVDILVVKVQPFELTNPVLPLYASLVGVPCLTLYRLVPTKFVQELFLE